MKNLILFAIVICIATSCTNENPPVHMYVETKNPKFTEISNLSVSDKELAKTHLKLILERMLRLSKSMDPFDQGYGILLQEIHDSVVPDFDDEDRNRILNFMISDTYKRGRQVEITNQTDTVCIYEDWIWVISKDFKEFLSTMGFKSASGGESSCNGTCTKIYLENEEGWLGFTLWIHVYTDRGSMITVRPFDWKDPSKAPSPQKVEKEMNMTMDDCPDLPLLPPPPPPPPPPL